MNQRWKYKVWPLIFRTITSNCTRIGYYQNLVILVFGKLFICVYQMTSTPYKTKWLPSLKCSCQIFVVKVNKKQRININFCFRLGNTTTRPHKMLKQMYGKTALFRSCTFEWFNHFWDVCECVEDEAQAGWLHSVCMPKTI